MLDKTLAELATGLEKGEFSSVELTQAYLDRIHKEDSRYNSFITVTDELALQQARAADQRRAEGQAELLTGIPMAHKDIFRRRQRHDAAGLNARGNPVKQLPRARNGHRGKAGS